MKKTINISSQDVSVLYHPDIDGHTMLIFTYVVYAFVCQAIALSGIVTNILNIICFVKQGFKDSVNISLLSKKVKHLYRFQGNNFNVLVTKKLVIDNLEDLYIYIEALCM